MIPKSEQVPPALVKLAHWLEGNEIALSFFYADKETRETITEGVEGFVAASEGCAPFQKILVGSRYLLLAIREAEQKGMLGGLE